MQGLLAISAYPSLPTFDYPQPCRVIFHEKHIENRGLTRDTCAGIQTLELLVPPEYCNYVLSHSAIAADASTLLETRFRSVPSLKGIIVNLKVYPQQDSSDGLTKTMRGYGWTVKVAKLPKKVWISRDGRVESDNEENCNVYIDEHLRREEEEEEHSHRRRDPDWKNDSDYD